MKKENNTILIKLYYTVPETKQLNKLIYFLMYLIFLAFMIQLRRYTEMQFIE